MWLLHVVVVQGGGHLQLGLVLWLLTAAAGGGFAALTGEASRPDGLLTNLAIAAVGGGLLNAATPVFGQDPVAALFGVRVFWAALGAFVALCIAHDAARRLPGGPIGERGGFLFLFTWLSGWPSEPGLVTAHYDHGLGLKLLPASLHYQVRRGPLTSARAIPLHPGVSAQAEQGALVVRERSGKLTRLDGIEPPEALGVLARMLCEQVATATALACDANQTL